MIDIAFINKEAKQFFGGDRITKLSYPPTPLKQARENPQMKN